MSVPVPPLDLYHITSVDNLSAILASGGLRSDATLAAAAGVPSVIGYSHIKHRRLTQYTVDCCSGRFVGEFVPFYFCPRSPMLYTINRGNTGKPPGCQTEILHLVTTLTNARSRGREWAIADGNAGAGHTTFSSDIDSLKTLDWTAIRATQWRNQTHQKSAEFLVADFFDWSAIVAIGCHNAATKQKVDAILATQSHRPQVTVQPTWYY
jgi:hypothetical protein